MKKIFLGLFVCLLSACTLGVANTPKEIVKEFLDKYKNQDSEVLDNLDETISSEYTGEYKERYKTLMINQYKDMDYKITDEVVDGNTALVTADITVYDYSSAIDNANNYLSEHEDEFYKDSSDETTREEAGNDTNSESGVVSETKDKVVDTAKFLQYKLGLLEDVKDKKTYTIEFSLTKEDDKWKLDSLSDTDIEKLHGIYSE